MGMLVEAIGISMAKIRAKNEPGIQERIGLDNYCHSHTFSEKMP
jgi:hypothetical protein